MASKKKTRFHTSESFFDYTLLCTVFFLIVFGLVMIYSTSSYQSGTTYLKQQAFSVALGLIAMFFVARVDYHFWRKFAIPAIVVSCVLILLLLSPLGMTRNGATRWLNLGISLQPAEVAKVGVILFLASIISKFGKSVRPMQIVVWVFVPTALVAMLIFFISNNLSSAIIVAGIAMAMLFVASPDYKKFVIMALALIAVVTAYVFYVKSQSGAGGFRGTRILAWMNPEQYADGPGFQTLQALYAIGSGGIFGKGLGQSMQKRGFIPEAQNDMIFSVLCEELGLCGASVVLLLFAILIWRCMIIANNAKDRFGAMLVVGVMSHLAIQVILNVAVVTNTIPNTGISLPFISYGGSSVFFLLIEIGLVLSVARNIELREMV